MFVDMSYGELWLIFPESSLVLPSDARCWQASQTKPTKARCARKNNAIQPSKTSNYNSSVKRSRDNH